jgi:hypothetical protein
MRRRCCRNVEGWFAEERTKRRVSAAGQVHDRRSNLQALSKVQESPELELIGALTLYWHVEDPKVTVVHVGQTEGRQFKRSSTLGVFIGPTPVECLVQRTRCPHGRSLYQSKGKNISTFGRTERCFCYTRLAMLSHIKSMYRCCLAGHIARVLEKVLAESSGGPEVLRLAGRDLTEIEQ